MWALVCATLLLGAASARGADLVYWTNFDADSVAFSDLSGGGGGTLSLGGVKLANPEGMAIDSAGGRLFVASQDGGPGDAGRIVAVNLDGSGASVFSAPGAPVDDPSGLAIDPIAGIVYWGNADGNGGSISWARLDGSAGGTLNTGGATPGSPRRLAIDPAGGRIYWVHSGAVETISFANLNGTGGDDLNLEGATPVTVRAIAVDSAAGRVYWLDQATEQLSFAATAGTGGQDLGLPASSVISSPFGLAFDPAIGRFYWGNSSAVGPNGALGFADLTGAGGGIDVATAPISGPQDAIVLKSPAPAGAPTVVRADKSPSTLACSTGAWAPDFAASFVYRAPSKFAYQWLRDGKPVPGATASTLTATAGGDYTCAVTASNQAGPTTQTSAATAIEAAQLQLTLRKKVRVKPGRQAKLKLQIANVGDVASGPASLCLKTGKRAKALKASKCKKLGPIPGGASLTGTLRLKVGAAASGTYQVKLTVKGATAKPAKTKIVVRGSK